MDANGLFVIDVSADVDRLVGGFMHDIRVEHGRRARGGRRRLTLAKMPSTCARWG
jgi:hypothetical protein